VRVLSENSFCNAKFWYLGASGRLGQISNGSTVFTKFTEAVNATTLTA